MYYIKSDLTGISIILIIKKNFPSLK